MSGIAVAAGAVGIAYYLLTQSDKKNKTDILKGWTGALPGANQSGRQEGNVMEDNPTCPEGTDLNPNDGLCYSPFNPCGEWDGFVLSADGKQCVPPGGNPATGESLDSMDDICAKEFGEGWLYDEKANLCNPPPGGNPCAGAGLGGQDLEFWPKSEGGDDMCHYPDAGTPECPVGHVWRKDDRGEYRCMRGHQLDIGLSSQHLAVQILAETGLSYASYMALDAGGRAAARAARAAATQASNAAARASVNAAGRAAMSAAGGAGTAAGVAAGNAARAARLAAQQSARAATQAAQAARAAAAAARTTRFGLMMARMSSTPFGLIFMIIAQILIAVLGLNPDEFELCRGGEIDLSALPDWARILIESIPFAGDLFAMIAPTICIRTGCEAPNVEQHGLCYPPPRPNFWCEAFLCYSQHPAWEANGQLHTTTHITKNIPMDTGTIPLSCPEGARLDGVLCYWPPEWSKGEGNPGVNIVAGVAWENCRPGATDTGIRCEDVYGGGVGRLRDCPPGWTDTGLFCNEPIGSSMNACPPGSDDVAGTCWGEVGADICGDNCGAGWDNCRHRTARHYWGLGNWTGGDCIGGCRMTCSRARGITKQLHQRDLKTWGGHVEPRAAGSSLPCPAGTTVGGDGLCYEACREGYTREGLLCSRSYTKRSEVLAPFSPSCPADRIDGGPWGSAGLCYMANLPEGYRRVVAGTIEQMCPTVTPEQAGGGLVENVVDIGVGCQRARYDRGAGTIPFGIRVKARRSGNQAPPLPPTCEERRAIFRNLDEKGQDTHEPVVCIEAPCAEDEDITGDGLICVPRCRDGYRRVERNGVVFCARDASASVTADEYEQRPNREIDFGFE